MGLRIPLDLNQFPFSSNPRGCFSFKGPAKGSTDDPKPASRGLSGVGFGIDPYDASRNP